MGLCDSTKQIYFDDSRRGKWWLVPRDGGEPQLVETEPLMIWHYGNAFEDEKTGQHLPGFGIAVYWFGSRATSYFCTLLLNLQFPEHL